MSYERIRSVLGNLTFSILGLGICAFCALALFEGLDRWFLGSEKDESLYSRERTFATTYLDLVSGAEHIASNHKHKGPASWEWIEYEAGYDLVSNKFGFFTEFPLDEFPEKASNEFRIVLIGGSGAQGHGARTNADMFYSIVQDRLAEEFEERIQLSIINLAMASHHSVSNLFVLRGFAHPLKPDLILAYNGINDTSQVMARGGFLPSKRPSGLKDQNASYPFYLDWLVDLFPRTMLKYGVAPKIRSALGEDRFEVDITYDLPREFFPGIKQRKDDLHVRDPKKFYDDYVVQGIIQSFKAMKREFCGIPIVFVRQISGPDEASNSYFEKTYGLEGKLESRFYDEWWKVVQRELPGYLNDSWYFLDAHRAIWDRVSHGSGGPVIDWISGEKVPITGNTFAVHLDNLGHKLFAEWLAIALVPIIEEVYPSSREDLCEVNFRGSPS